MRVPHERTNGTKAHIASDTRGFRPAAGVTSANEQECPPVGELAVAVQDATGESVKAPYVDQGYAGEQRRQDAANHGIVLCVVKRPAAR